MKRSLIVITVVCIVCVMFWNVQVASASASGSCDSPQNYKDCMPKCADYDSCITCCGTFDDPWYGKCKARCKDRFKATSVPAGPAEPAEGEIFI